MPSNTSSPELLERRTLTGIFVHLFVLLPGALVLAGLVYLVSDHPFTRANIRNALNWYFTVFALLILSFLTFFLGGDGFEVTGYGTVDPLAIPEPVDTILVLVGVVFVIALVIAILLSLFYPFIATAKAIFGTAWKYPFAYEFISGDD